jgi:hypothetical protein
LHGFVSHVTAVFLLAHTLLGCCWHHVHACGHEHGVFALIGWEHDGDLRHGHAVGASKPSGDRHPDRDECRGSKCNFVAAKDEFVVTKNLTARSPAAAWQLAGLPCLAVDRARVGGLLHPALVRAGVLLLPVRLHLANQVLLI